MKLTRLLAVVLFLPVLGASTEAQNLLYQFDGEGTGDDFGYAVSDAGDVNNDGIPDVIVGAPNDDPNGSDSGSARVFSGLDSTVLHTFDGSNTDGHFGYSVSGVGDLNGDGFADVIVGSPDDDGNGTDSGAAQVYSGSDGIALLFLHGHLRWRRTGVLSGGRG